MNIKCTKPGLIFLLIMMTGCAGTVKHSAPQMLTIEEEVEFGRQLARAITRHYRLIENAEINNYFNEMGQKIADHSDWEGLDYQFNLLNTDKIFFFSLPGGYIYLSRGLFEILDEASEAAAVMAFEVANVVNRNVSRQLVEKYGIAIFAQEVEGEDMDELWSEVISELFTDGSILNFSPDEETESDRLAMQYLHKSKIDPIGLISLYTRIAKLIETDPLKAPELMRTRYVTKKRIDKATELVVRYPVTVEFLKDEPRFHEIKARLYESY